MDIETELDQILAKLGMDPLGFRLSFRWLKEVILYAVYNPNTWRESYLDLLGKAEANTHEFVRQSLYKAVWDHWTPRSVHILSEHLGHPVQTKFKYVKPNHIEFITLLSEELRKKHPSLPA